VTGAAARRAFTLDVLHCDVLAAVGFADLVDGADVWMIESGSASLIRDTRASHWCESVANFRDDCRLAVSRGPTPEGLAALGAPDRTFEASEVCPPVCPNAVHAASGQRARFRTIQLVSDSHVQSAADHCHVFDPGMPMRE
jgi:hypothetical protein